MKSGHMHQRQRRTMSEFNIYLDGREGLKSILVNRPSGSSEITSPDRLRFLSNAKIRKRKLIKFRGKVSKNRKTTL